jgi:hypothetical protein
MKATDLNLKVNKIETKLEEGGIKAERKQNTDIWKK